MQLEFNDKVEIQYFQGEDLLKENLNMVHAVGKGSRNPPVMVNLFYKGNPQSPENIIALVGKGVVFDAGGLNIKVN